MAKKQKPIVSAPGPEPTILSLAEGAWSEVEHVKKGAIKLHFWLMSIISLVQPYAVGWFDATDTLPRDPWSFYLAVLQTTAPLTIGLAIWAALLIGFWPDNSEGGYVMFMGLIGGLILTVAAHIGNALGAAQVELIDSIQVLGPFNVFANALLSYLRAYRGVLFISSVGIAAYAGFITYRYAHAHLAGTTVRPNENVNPTRRAA